MSVSFIIFLKWNFFSQGTEIVRATGKRGTRFGYRKRQKYGDGSVRVRRMLFSMPAGASERGRGHICSSRSLSLMLNGLEIGLPHRYCQRTDITLFSGIANDVKACIVGTQGYSEKKKYFRNF